MRALSVLIFGGMAVALCVAAFAPSPSILSDAPAPFRAGETYDESGHWELSDNGATLCAVTIDGRAVCVPAYRTIEIVKESSL